MEKQWKSINHFSATGRNEADWGPKKLQHNTQKKGTRGSRVGEGRGRVPSSSLRWAFIVLPPHCWRSAEGFVGGWDPPRPARRSGSVWGDRGGRLWGRFATRAGDRRGRAGSWGLSTGRCAWRSSGPNRRWGTERRTPMENFRAEHTGRLQRAPGVGGQPRGWRAEDNAALSPRHCHEWGTGGLNRFSLLLASIKIITLNYNYYKYF
jgi:hypothetical protein